MTAVEWLIQQLVELDKQLDGRRKNDDATVIKLNPTKIYEQAKQMEKQQMEESFAEGYKSGIIDYKDIQNGYDGIAIDFTQYYDKKYGNELVQKMQQFGNTEQLKKKQ